MVKNCLVFGKNGLIGKSIVGSLKRTHQSVFSNPKIDWGNKELVAGQIRDSVAGFFDGTNDENWVIFWFAGKGGFSVPQEQFDFDEVNFRCFLEAVEEHMKDSGLVVLSSSAGALYSSNSDLTFDETSSINPNSSYGKMKMRQEAALSSFATRTGCPSLITRISTVYGPGSDFRSGYGLINHLCLADITRSPLEIFVPMETSRNYIYSEDAGELVVRFALSFNGNENKLQIRNIVAPSSVSVAEIVSTCSKIFKRKVVFSNRIDNRQDSYNTRFDIKTLFLSDVQQIYWTPISVGIARVRHALNLQLQSVGLDEYSNQEV